MLDFEKPISELEGKVKELRHLSSGSELDLADEITRLEARAEKLLRQTYAKLNAWQKTQVARHPERPHFSDYVGRLLEDYTPLAGDRTFGDDRAIQGGLARFRSRSVVVIGHEADLLGVEGLGPVDVADGEGVQLVLHVHGASSGRVVREVYPLRGQSRRQGAGRRGG